MSEKLKPCPFCGGDAKVRTWTDACELFAVVKCTQCGAESNMADDGTKTKGENIADAVASWNKRAGRNETIEECAKLCEEKTLRHAGYHGRWEGYGPWMGDKTGAECAMSIRALTEGQP